MTFLQIEYFVTLAKQLNFSKAANQMYVSQAAISKQITLLEQELGFVLFHRGYRSLSLTPAGEEMFRFWDKTLGDYNEILTHAKEIAEESNFHLRIGLLDGNTYPRLNQAVSCFTADYPRADVDVEFNDISSLKTGLLEGRYDLIFSFTGAEDTPGGIRVLPLDSRRFALFYSASHPFADKPDLKLSDFSDSVFIFPFRKDDAAGIRFHKSQIMEACGFEPKEILFTGSVESAFASIPIKNTVSMLHEDVKKSGIRVFSLPTDCYQDMCVLWDERLRNGMIDKLLNYIKKEGNVG